MALADILQYIEKESQKKADNIILIAKENEKEIIGDAEKKAQEYSSYRFHEFEEEKVFREKKSSAKMQQYEKMELAKFNISLVDSIYTSFLDSLSAFSTEDVKKICSVYLSRLSEDAGVVVSAGTDEKILKEVVKECGKNFTVESGDLKTGGFIFQGDGYSVDFTFPTIVNKYLRENTEADLLNILVS